MKSPRINIGTIRRRQIVDAAWAIIAEQGLPKLSLSVIEKKVQMSRGQLTYYFKTKEDIFLAVFDRLMEQCQQRGRPGDGDPGHPLGQAGWEEAVAFILRRLLLNPGEHKPEFHALHYTFLAQISHREDFRARLARLYEDWRRAMTDHLGQTLQERPAERKIASRSFATIVQALINGLAVQAAVDPHAFDGEEVIEMCLDMLRSYLWPRNKKSRPRVSPKPTRNGKHKPSANGKSVLSR